ncbi:hypothetical protein [Sphingomonas sp. Leaf257]|jgi:hypothetical protein|uniref:hypothetical protein n=1 Tax=Sphingomonas sp. Leaf257 TaxID=1736309 RepID=UPI0006F3300B|nr:hypothetical protein [Sphingomonas sp. Leaf257]KQO50546.1 hypothetical protein ASF14_10640 [Sphingomonas sp. Leaf257]
MFLIAIRRYVKPDCEGAFLAHYELEKANHPDFRGETLTKIVDDSSIPEPMRGLFTVRPDCINFLNLAKWERWESFDSQCEMSSGNFDSRFEVAPRERHVLEIVKTVEGND